MIKPTPWISSLVIDPKKNGTLRLCLDPKDLNKAILRENYPLPTIEDVATRLHGAKVFSILDVSCGFWHVELDEASSHITTFHTPFGRYRWKRMPFGISSAPEVFQRRMHELIEDLHGVEVIADDFMVVGFGDNEEQATKSHDTNLESFMKRCEEKGIHLNAEKAQLRKHKVPFIGHIATGEGLQVYPAKVKAICEMPPPTDVAAVQRLLGFVQYLSKFLPHLADITKPLRELTQRDTEWVWDEPQESALQALKTVVTRTPVLRYYNSREEVTLQCDASQSGLGAALLQQGQPVAYASRALTSAETRYAQIEKELLAILFACTHFDIYLYGRELVTVETDHKPLESIFLKPLNEAPLRLQRMLLRLQRYSLRVKYKKGDQLFLADTLSRAYVPDICACEFSQRLEGIDHASSLALDHDRLQRIRDCSRNDPVISVLRETIQHGWPEQMCDVPECIHPYRGVRDVMTVESTLVFKGHRVVIPQSMRKEMIELAHEAHIGMEGCIRRARESMFWPRMTAEIKDYVGKCDICLMHRASQGKEPLMQHQFADRPWSKVGADLCELPGRMLLVVVDYYSNFVEAERVHKATTSGVTKVLRPLFARYGVPDVLFTDNGPQFDSSEFEHFAKQWGFDHKTSSPGYPQSNGKAENAVKMIKQLFKKCKESGQSQYMALLNWRNTPSEGIGTSPAQCFLGRRCRTKLPLCEALLSPRYPTDKDSQALAAQKVKQKHYYNRQTKLRSPISPGETVRMRLPGEKTWTSGTCTGLVAPRSYDVQVGERHYQRNRRHILQTGESLNTDSYLEMDLGSKQLVDGQSSQSVEPCSPQYVPQSQSMEPPVLTEEQCVQLSEQETPPLRRSERIRKAPSWMTDYVHS